LDHFIIILNINESKDQISAAAQMRELFVTARPGRVIFACISAEA